MMNDTSRRVRARTAKFPTSAPPNGNSEFNESKMRGNKKLNKVLDDDMIEF